MSQLPNKCTVQSISEQRSKFVLVQLIRCIALSAVFLALSTSYCDELMARVGIPFRHHFMYPRTRIDLHIISDIVLWCQNVHLLALVLCLIASSLYFSPLPMRRIVRDPLWLVCSISALLLQILFSIALWHLALQGDSILSLSDRLSHFRWYLWLVLLPVLVTADFIAQRFLERSRRVLQQFNKQQFDTVRSSFHTLLN